MNRYSFVKNNDAPRNPKVYELKWFMDNYIATPQTYDFFKNYSHKYPDMLEFIHKKVTSCKKMHKIVNPEDILLWVYLEFKDNNMIIRMNTVGGVPMTIHDMNSYYDPIIVPLQEYYE